MKKPMKTKHPQSKFRFDPHNMRIVEGKGPTKDGQLVKGETLEGSKMELVGTLDDQGMDWVAYWSWS